MRTGSLGNVGQLLSAGRVNYPWIDLALRRRRMDTGLIGDVKILVLSKSGRLVDLTPKSKKIWFATK